MLTFNAAIAAVTTASLTYIGLSLAAANVKSRARRVGGITFIRLASWQLSFCRPRPAAAIKAERLAAAVRRSQSRLDTIARLWCEGR